MAMELTLSVMGLGHVGLPTALGLAELGWTVLGVDQDEERAAHLQNGRAPFYEPGLDEALAVQLQRGRFRSMTNSVEAIRPADAVFICVDTPQRADGDSDLSKIETVARAVASHARGYTLLVQKSTAPVRTASRIAGIIAAAKSGTAEIEVAVNPEFLQEGTALHDVRHPDRVIIGVDSDRARRLLESIYRPLAERLPRPGECRVCDEMGRTQRADWLVVTDPTTAEITKHAANAYLTARLSFMNMVADLCEATGADVTKVAQAMGLDPRIGSRFLRAGVGFGGACLPKDLRTFIRVVEDLGVDASLPRAASVINERRIILFVDKIRAAVGPLEGKTIGLLGLAFKPDTDDIREAPSLKIARMLLASGAMLRVHDPRAAANFVAALGPPGSSAVVCTDPHDVAMDAHAVALVTEWEDYARLDLLRLKSSMVSPVLVDGRNLFDPAAVRSLGFTYLSIGRP